MTEGALFGRRLREIRKARKLRIGQLAEKADTGVKHLGRIERGEKQPSFELIIALSKALNISPSDLFDFDSNRPDVRTLKLQFGRLLDKLDIRQLQTAYNVLRALVRP